MQGSYQNQNATIALRASDILNYKLPVAPNKSKAALKDVKMLGRWQTIEGKPKIILDACHNSAGALCLRENLKNLQEKPEIWIGVLGEDRAKDIIAVVADFAKSIKLFEVNQPRACSFAFLRSIIPKSFKGEVVNFELQKVKERLFYSDSKNTILVTGSIYLIGDILSLLKSSNFEQNFNWSDIF
jgi:folylpolyglutamate synthase/dihydropteroate synthase